MSSLSLFYLIGAPGVGKTTLMSELTGQLARHAVTKPFAYDVLVDETRGSVVGAELGARREKFSGTDALSMSVMNRAVPWIRERPFPLILAEGQRLANMRFFHAAVDAGYAVSVVYLEAPPAALEARRTARGSHQDPTWLRAATTRVTNLVNDVSKDPRLLLVSVAADVYSARELALILQHYPALEKLNCSRKSESAREPHPKSLSRSAGR